MMTAPRAAARGCPSSSSERWLGKSPSWSAWVRRAAGNGGRLPWDPQPQPGHMLDPFPPVAGDGTAMPDLGWGAAPRCLSQNPVETPRSPPVLLVGEAASGWVGGWPLAKVNGPCTTPLLFHTLGSSRWVWGGGRRGCVTRCHGRGRQRTLR